MQSIEIAVSLVKQAIDQDRRKNYQEAARCYREALNLFNNASKSKGLNKSVKQAITVKCNQYENRLGKLEKFLFESKDLTPLFKDVVEYQYHKRPDSQSSFSDESISSEHWKGLKNCSLFKQGIQQIGENYFARVNSVWSISNFFETSRTLRKISQLTSFLVKKQQILKK